MLLFFLFSIFACFFLFFFKEIPENVRWRSLSFHKRKHGESFYVKSRYWNTAKPGDGRKSWEKEKKYQKWTVWTSGFSWFWHSWSGRGGGVKLDPLIRGTGHFRWRFSIRFKAVFSSLWGCERSLREKKCKMDVLSLENIYSVENSESLAVILVKGNTLVCFIQINTSCGLNGLQYI